MGRHFFTGGMMPSEQLYFHLQDDLLIERHWRVNGRHYGRTLRAWLAEQDAQRDIVMPIMADVYGESEKVRWFNRWRIFFLACAELFDYTNGEEWYVTHYLFRRRD
jgi:cyclopropane-fatty-acyl-phospholipid synthase